MSSSESNQRAVFRAEVADFFGVPVTLLTPIGRDGDGATAVTFDSIDAAMPEIRKDVPDLEYEAKFVSIAGTSVTIRAVDISAFFAAVMCVSSPRIMEFKQFLNRNRHGNFRDHTRGPEAYVPAELKGTPLGQLIGAASFLAIEQERLKQRVDGISQEVRAVQDQVGKDPQSWTVEQWLAQHDVKATPELVAEEEAVCQRIFDRITSN